MPGLFRVMMVEVTPSAVCRKTFGQNYVLFERGHEGTSWCLARRNSEMNLMFAREVSKDSKHVNICFLVPSINQMLEVKNRYNEKARQRCLEDDRFRKQQPQQQPQQRQRMVVCIILRWVLPGEGNKTGWQRWYITFKRLTGLLQCLVDGVNWWW